MSKEALIFCSFTTQNIAHFPYMLDCSRLVGIGVLSKYDGMLSDIRDGSHSECDNCQIH